MQNNTLVVCGGTGAHVALALVRLHTLGQPLGFFRDADDKPLAFPTIYLVDQDSGDGDQEDTAWQRTRRLVASHPGRHDWRAAIGRPDAPEPKEVTPLPVGPDRGWSNPPHDRLGRRFADSAYLDLLTSRAQRHIRFSHGMMGSPAVGSLLFRLKELDTKPGGLDTNHDGAYHELLSTRGRVAVVGSAVGGTGASVAPTLAQRLAGDGDDVMAVMVLNWFRFEQEGLDEATLEKAQHRNRAMVENADSAFAYYGRRLAHRVATVPVGAPHSAIRTRRYTSDTRQPIRESFVHGVAALCCLQQFLDREPRPPGLYQLGAEDPTRLGGGNRLPGAENHSVQSLANQAATLADVLEVFARTLAGARTGGPFRVVPAICQATEGLGAPDRVGPALDRLVGDYRKHIEWMKDVLGTAPRPDLSLTREALSRERLAVHRLKPGAGSAAADAEAAALALLHWTADWVRNHARGDGAATLAVPPARAADRGYWPPLVGHDALNVAAKKPGELTQVPAPNVQGTVEGFVRAGNLAQNGWPDPMATARHFRYAIEQEHATERRQLEMLLAGVVTGGLTLRNVAVREDPPLLSLDHLVQEYRKSELPELARVAVVHEHRDGDVALGFNSPLTLFCPTPIENDERRERAWGALWQALTGSERPRDWRTEEMAEWRPAGPAVRRIRTWIERQQGLLDGAAPPWTRVFADHPASTPKTFGMGRKLPAYWGTGVEAAPVTLALPTELPEGWPDEETPRIPEGELPAALASVLKSVKTGAGVTFEMVHFTLPDRDATTRAFWREHLDHLQLSGDVAAFYVRAGERRLAVLTSDGRTAAILDNVVVLDRDAIMARDCAPMRQEPVHGSSPRTDDVRYPDYPLRADYLGLVETEGGRRVVDLLRNGETVRPAPPSIDQGPRRPSAKATWELRLAGRSDRLPITLSVPRVNATGEENGHHRAHWMVWPRFRSRAGQHRHWRAYYVYQHCTDARLHLSTLWLDPDDGRVRRRPPPPPERGGAHPVRFHTGDQRAHTGGPPIAFALENSVSGQELGLYVLNLVPLGQRQADVKVGLDFGTSHTVASVRADGGRHLVELTPDLVAARDDTLILHVSENRSHVTDPIEELGLKALGVWLPTYADEPVPEEMKGLLPSELLTIEPLASLSGDDPSNWQPGIDCVIPFMDMQRRDLADHVLADFKWQASAAAFREREHVLREIYLGMAIELVMADVVWRRLRALPAQVAFTFTYPLRSAPAQVQDYQHTLLQVMDSATRSLGSECRLVDDIGIYNESRAAKGGTAVFGEVCLVGDLGGGTLDLFISAEPGGGVEFEEVADSAKIGGNELLHMMAKRSDLFLPPGWKDSTDNIQAKLRAWMRSKGSARLFGDGKGEPEHHAGLKGFATPKEAGNARALLGRYFRLIVEYMARSLVAYLVRHWYARVLENRPGDHQELSVLVQLRGNGWRLWPDHRHYAGIERHVAGAVAARAAELWRDRAGDRDAWHGQDDLWRKHGLWEDTEGRAGPTVGAPTCSAEGSRDANPKAAPILQVVGLAQRHEEIHTYTHALVELKVVTMDEANRKIRWFDRLPAPTGGGGARVEFHRIEPPFSLSHPDAAAGTRRELDDLEPNLKRGINRELDEFGITREVDFFANIAAIVWEHAFRSKHFVDGE